MLSRPAALALAAGLMASACKPGPDTYFSPTRNQRRALEAVEQAAQRCRATLLERPEAEDAAAWEALADSLEALKAADRGTSYGPESEAHLAARARLMVDEAARALPPAARERAAARALRAWRRHILSRFPQAGRFL